MFVQRIGILGHQAMRNKEMNHTVKTQTLM